MNMAQKYIRVTKTLENKGKLFTPEEFDSFLTTKKDVDYYYSTFYYNDKHKEIFDQTGSVKGIRDVTGDSLYFDFDSPDFELVRKDTLELINRFKKENINIKCVLKPTNNKNNFCCTMCDELIVFLFIGVVISFVI